MVEWSFRELMPHFIRKTMKAPLVTVAVRWTDGFGGYSSVELTHFIGQLNEKGNVQV